MNRFMVGSTALYGRLLASGKTNGPFLTGPSETAPGSSRLGCGCSMAKEDDRADPRGRRRTRDGGPPLPRPRFRRTRGDDRVRRPECAGPRQAGGREPGHGRGDGVPGRRRRRHAARALRLHRLPRAQGPRPDARRHPAHRPRRRRRPGPRTRRGSRRLHDQTVRLRRARRTHPGRPATRRPHRAAAPGRRRADARPAPPPGTRGGTRRAAQRDRVRRPARPRERAWGRGVPSGHAARGLGDLRQHRPERRRPVHQPAPTQARAG